jgi:hypothetical protein
MDRQLIRTLLAAAVLAVAASSSALPQEAQIVRILGESALWGGLASSSRLSAGLASGWRANSGDFSPSSSRRNAVR